MSPSKGKGPGAGGNVSRYHSKVTFGLRLIDAFTGGAPQDSRLQVESEDILRRPVIKPSGEVVFSGIDYMPAYRLHVRSRFYIPLSLTVRPDDLDAEYPVELAVIHPCRSYPFHASATVFRGTVQDEKGLPVENVTLVGRMLSAGSQRARLAQPMDRGDVWIRLAEMTGQIRPGDELELRDERKEHSETRRIVTTSDENHRIFRMNGPIEHSYGRGANVYPVYAAVTDAEGEWIMPIRESCPTSFQLEIQVTHNGSNQRLTVAGVAGSNNPVETVVVP